MALSLQEQEVHINFNRNEDCAQMYCSDEMCIRDRYMDGAITHLVNWETEQQRIEICPYQFILVMKM